MEDIEFQYDYICFEYYNCSDTNVNEQLKLRLLDLFEWRLDTFSSKCLERAETIPDLQWPNGTALFK